MSEDELKAEAVRLLNAFGDWPGGRAWWVDAGWPEPPRELMEAVKFEMVRRKWAANPPPRSAAYFPSRPSEPDASDETCPTRGLALKGSARMKGRPGGIAAVSEAIVTRRMTPNSRRDPRHRRHHDAVPQRFFD